LKHTRAIKGSKNEIITRGFLARNVCFAILYIVTLYKQTRHTMQ